MAIVQPGIRRNQEVTYQAAANTLTFWAEIDGLKVDPDAGATVSIFQPGNDTATVSAAATTEDGTTNQLSYVLDASNDADYPLDEHYRAEWTFVSNGITHTRRKMFDVVRVKMNDAVPLRVDDVKNVHASIDAALTQASQESDFHSRYIIPAWQDVLTWVGSQGWRPALISSPETLYQLVYYRTIYKYFKGLQRDPNDNYARLAGESLENYEAEKLTTVLKYNFADTFWTDEVRGFQQPRLLIGNDLRRGGQRFLSQVRSLVGGVWR